MTILTQELLLHAERRMRYEDVSRTIMLAGLNRTLDEWLCDPFVELIEEMELWKWDDATRDFWSRLAKALQQSNISVTWAELLNSRLASVHTTGKLSWAAATGSNRECKMRIERIGGSRLDTDSEVWGLDQTTWELLWAGEAAMRKSIPALRQAGYESISDLPRIQESYREKALVVIPPAIRICATSNGEQRVQVLIPVVQGLSQKQRQLMQQYFELVDWQGLKLPSAERKRQDSLKIFEHSVEVWKDWIRLKKELATLGEEPPPSELLPAKRKKQSLDPTKTNANKEEFGRIVLAGGNMWDLLSCMLTLLERFDNNNPEMGIGSVARQMHQKMDGAALLGQHS